jgi:hypothetical protein
MQDLDQAIRDRAYQLWLAEGRQDGNAEAHWLAAQREVLASSLEGLGTAGVAPKRKAQKKSSSKKARAA